MNLIINTVMQEKQRIVYMIDRYKEALSCLPKGSLTERRIGEKTYYYLKYRENGKVISKYVPFKNAETVREEIDKRKHIEAMLLSLKKESELSDRIIGGSI